MPETTRGPHVSRTGGAHLSVLWVTLCAVTLLVSCIRVNHRVETRQVWTKPMIKPAGPVADVSVLGYVREGSMEFILKGIRPCTRTERLRIIETPVFEEERTGVANALLIGGWSMTGLGVLLATVGFGAGEFGVGMTGVTMGALSLPIVGPTTGMTSGLRKVEGPPFITEKNVSTKRIERCAPTPLAGKAVTGQLVDGSSFTAATDERGAFLVDMTRLPPETIRAKTTIGTFQVQGVAQNFAMQLDPVSRHKLLQLWE
jgi:hypothetical protein